MPYGRRMHLRVPRVLLPCVLVQWRGTDAGTAVGPGAAAASRVQGGALPVLLAAARHAAGGRRGSHSGSGRPLSEGRA